MIRPIEWSKPAIDVGIVITDWPKQRVFYEVGLGLRHLGDIPLQAGTVHIFECGDSFLKLYQLSGGTARPAAEFGSQLGLAYITLNVRDLDSVRAELEDRGVSTLGPIVPFESSAPLLAPAGLIRARVCMLTDPEGNRIELLERY